jgi:acyl-CoA synthetase (AMP-forming)/AMP-acid ligase II
MPWAGAAINPINTRWSATEIAYSLNDCDTRVLLIDDAFFALLPQLRAASRSLTTVITSHTPAQSPLQGARSRQTRKGFRGAPRHHCRSGPKRKMAK